MILLRVSAARKLDYLMRCVDPTVMTTSIDRNDDYYFYLPPPCSDHDNMIEATFVKRLGLNLNSDHLTTMKQARLPVRAGGFGLVASADRATMCYFSSLALAMRTKTALGTFEKLSDPEEIRKHPELRERINFTLRDLREERFEESPLLKELPRSCEEFLKKFVTPAGQQLSLPVGMQSKITKSTTGWYKRTSSMGSTHDRP
jgi:hypothetical protein